MKMVVFWIVEPCSLVEAYRRFKGAYCLITLVMEAASTCLTCRIFTVNEINVI
jgi:hypothetical protein